MKESVLIIENDPDARELVSMLFDCVGFIVYTALVNVVIEAAPWGADRVQHFADRHGEAITRAP